MPLPRTCSRCGTLWRDPDPPRFHDRCAGCGTYLHSCRHCRAYEFDGRRWACISRTADAPADAAAQNSCDEFEFSGAAAAPADLGTKPRAHGADAFRRLFGES